MPHRATRSCLRLLLLAILPLSFTALAEDVPAPIAGLIPDGAILFNNDWGVLETEFGKTFSAGMDANFPGLPSSCDNTIGPELRLTIKGDTAWEEPPMLDMAIQIHNDEIAGVVASMSSSLKTQLQSNAGLVALGDLHDEEVEGGRLVYAEYTENCEAHPNGKTTRIYGFSRKGATLLDFSLWMTKPASETSAMAREIIRRFQQLDIAALIK